MKQVTVLSGKGGTGKTILTGSLAALSDGAVFADCDVDASNLHLLLKPTVRKTIEFKGLKLARIDEAICTRCGLCEEKCRFGAIGGCRVDPIQCEGCGVCIIVCTVGAVSFEDRICGHAYVSDTRFGPMVHARLLPGMENSGKLVTLVRQTATRLAEETEKSLILVDGPPGIGCPVIASLSGVNAGVVVVEPTLSGIHDLRRALSLLDHFGIKPLVCVNKFDANTENSCRIKAFCLHEDIRLLGMVPFDEAVTKAMVEGRPVVEHAPDSPASKAINELWRSLLKELDSQHQPFFFQRGRNEPEKAIKKRGFIGLVSGVP